MSESIGYVHAHACIVDINQYIMHVKHNLILPTCIGTMSAESPLAGN